MSNVNPIPQEVKPLSILIVHNAYKQRGGEDSVVESEIELLRKHGHDVVRYSRHNDELEGMSALSVVKDTVWSSKTVADLNLLIVAHTPDVIHIHNTFPIISPSAYWLANRVEIPVIQTLHNFRLMCPQAMFLRKEKVCEDCLGHVPWRAVVHSCYRESKAQSVVLAGMVTIHRALGTWRNKVTRYIALNEFCRNKFIEGGLPAQRIVIKPNFVDFESPPDVSRTGFLFVGRLSLEKGIDTLCNAANILHDVEIKVAGTGPEEHQLKQSQSIVPLGALSITEVRQQMSEASALVLPSIWYENFPRTLVEAFACGLPVIASRIGALAELVEDGVTGLLFEPGNSEDLARKMQWVLDNPKAAQEMGRNARSLYEKEFTAKRNYEQLMEIYRDAIDEVKHGIPA